MRIEALKYRTDDKQDIIIVVGFYESHMKTVWKIDDIKYKTSRQREYKYYSNTFRDNYEYRRLETEERDNYRMQKYIEFVGKDKLNEAVMAAWQMMKPDLENISTGNI